MRVYHSIEDFPAEINTIITIGTFDGVHKGHKQVIKRINDIAKKQGCESVLLTFFPHPRHVLYPDDQQLKLLNTIEGTVVRTLIACNRICYYIASEALKITH